MGKLNALAKLVLENFGPILIFYAVSRAYGLKPAIAASIIFTIAEIIYKIRKKEELPSLFKFSTGMTLVLGAIDLYSQRSLLFKYEACITNIVTGLFFAASVFAEKTVLQEFREKGADAKPMTRDRIAYFKFLTSVWAAYFFAKAYAYFWMASNMSLEQGLFIRTVLGSSSFYAMLFVSIVGSKKLFPIMKRWNLLPPAEPEVEKA